IGQVAAEDRGDVHQCSVSAIEDRAFLVREHPVLDEIEDQQRAHAVVGESLPHLGEEQHEQAAWMAEDGLLLLGFVRIGGHWFLYSPDRERRSADAARPGSSTDAASATFKNT